MRRGIRVRISHRPKLVEPQNTVLGTYVRLETTALRPTYHRISRILLSPKPHLSKMAFFQNVHIRTMGGQSIAAAQILQLEGRVFAILASVASRFPYQQKKPQSHTRASLTQAIPPVLANGLHAVLHPSVPQMFRSLLSFG